MLVTDYVLDTLYWLKTPMDPTTPSPQWNMYTVVAGYDGCWRVDLKGKLFPGIEDLNQQRESVGRCFSVPQQFGGVLSHQPAQIASGKGAIRNDAYISRTVANLPRLTDWSAARQVFAIELLEPAPAPDSFFRERSKK